jgi:hypothetical protein
VASRLGLSHPCTALDKWTLIPMVADADAEQPVVVDLIRTWFLKSRTSSRIEDVKRRRLRPQ